MTLADWCRKHGVNFHPAGNGPVTVPCIPESPAYRELQRLADFVPSEWMHGTRIGLRPRTCPEVIGPNDIRLMEQSNRTTRDLIRAVLIYVAHDSEPDSYCPDDLLMIRRAFAGDPDAVSYINQILVESVASLGNVVHPGA